MSERSCTHIKGERPSLISMIGTAKREIKVCCMWMVGLQVQRYWELSPAFRARKQTENGDVVSWPDCRLNVVGT